MTKEEIKAAIYEYVNVIDNAEENLEEREKWLAITLDKILLARNFPSYENDENDYPDAPGIDYNKVREKISELFPNYGFYNIAYPISDKISDAENQVGDAIDDICDIYIDLKEIIWKIENNSVADGLNWFHSNISWHWMQHALALRLYIFSKSWGY